MSFREPGRTHTVIIVHTCGSCNIISRKPQQHDRLGTASKITGAFTGLMGTQTRASSFQTVSYCLFREILQFISGAELKPLIVIKCSTVVEILYDGNNVLSYFNIIYHVETNSALKYMH